MILSKISHAWTSGRLVYSVNVVRGSLPFLTTCQKLFRKSITKEQFYHAVISKACNLSKLLPHVFKWEQLETWLLLIRQGSTIVMWIGQTRVFSLKWSSSWDQWSKTNTKESVHSCSALCLMLRIESLIQQLKQWIIFCSYSTALIDILS